MKRFINNILLVLTVMVLLSACGGSNSGNGSTGDNTGNEDDNNAGNTTFTIGGTVSGFAGTGLVLQNNGGDDKAITANGPFTFDTALDDGVSYTVTVSTQPGGQTCAVTSAATGTISGTDTVDVTVNCTDNGPPDTTAPQVLSAPGILPLGNNQEIIIVFDESMDTSSLVLGGALGSGLTGGITWSNTNVTNDTLSLTSGWSLGEGQNLIVNANDLAENPLTTLNQTFNVYAGTLYFISNSATDDNGDGLSPATARQTIQAAIDAATAPASVIVNTGTYNVDSGAGSHVIMKEGVSLIGGYNTSYNGFDRAANLTTITDTSTVANDFSSKHKAIEAGAGITDATEIDGFTINGGGGDYSTGIDCSSASPLIENNIIDGGSGGVSYGVNVYPGGAPVIQYNTINDSSAGNASYGIYDWGSATIHMNTIYNDNTGITTAGGATSDIHNNTVNGSGIGIMNSYSDTTIHNNTITGNPGILSSGGAPVIRDNVINGGISNQSGTTARIEKNIIYGGDNSTSYGIINDSATPTIINNTIHGGTGSFQSTGISNRGSDAIIRNNTIDGGAGSPSIGIDIWTAPGPVIENNIIFSTSAGASNCIFEYDFDSSFDGDPVALRNNSLTSCTNVYVDQDAACTGDGDGDGDATTCTFSEMQALTDIASFADNIQVSAVFVDADGADNDITTMEDNDWHLTATTPVSVIQDGLNGNDEAWSFTDDKDGTVRPTTGSGWSMGAYEP